MNTKDTPDSQVDVCERLRARLDQRIRKQVADRQNPIVTLTYAQSIDGCIAPIGGGTLQLSNTKTQQMTHRIRALHDAILVGIDTVICDDPQLTVRLTSGQNPQPIVLDTRLRFPLDARLMSDPCLRPIIATGPNACSAKEDQLTSAGARVIRVPLQEDGLIDLFQLLPRIKELGLHSVMVEGGAKVITSLLASRIADHILLAISPRFVGGMRAVNPKNNGRQMPALHDVHYQPMEGDLVVWGHLDPIRDPGGARKSPATASHPLPE